MVVTDNNFFIGVQCEEAFLLKTDISKKKLEDFRRSCGNINGVLNALEMMTP